MPSTLRRPPPIPFHRPSTPPPIHLMGPVPHVTPDLISPTCRFPTFLPHTQSRPSAHSSPSFSPTDVNTRYNTRYHLASLLRKNYHPHRLQAVKSFILPHLHRNPSTQEPFLTPSQNAPIRIRIHHRRLDKALGFALPRFRSSAWFLTSSVLPSFRLQDLGQCPI